MDGFTDYAMKLLNHEGSSLFPPLMSSNFEQRYLNTNLFSAFSSSNLEMSTQQTADISDYGVLFSLMRRDPAIVFSYFYEDMSEFQKLLLLRSLADNENQHKRLMIKSEGNDLGELIKFPSKGELVEVESTVQSAIVPFNAEVANNQLFALEQIYSHQEGILPTTKTDEYDDFSPVPQNKRFRTSSSSNITPADHSYSTLEAILRNQYLLSIPLRFSSSVPLNSPPPPANRRSPAPKDVLARERRKLLSERIRCLQKLMPWDKKMDTATLLEEVYKYTKFLQAQVSVLQSMPCQSSFITPLQMKAVNNVGAGSSGSGKGNGGLYGGLERLNRQQLLQVLVNSPVAQTVLYSNGSCVYSREQLILMKNNFVLQQMMMMGSSSSSST